MKIGTLLGPEKTAAPLLWGWVLFSGRRPGWPSNASDPLLWGAGVVVVVWLGCVVVC